MSFDQIYEAGVQPDMVTFTPDSKKILSADEGEPRNGYEAGSIDPKGTVTVIDLTNQNVSHLDFTVFAVFPRGKHARFFYSRCFHQRSRPDKRSGPCRTTPGKLYFPTVDQMAPEISVSIQ